MRPEPPDFEPMFQPGTRYRLPDPAGTVAVVEVHDAGLLHLPTGGWWPATRSGARRCDARSGPSP